MQAALNSFLARALLEAAELPLDAAAVRHYLGAQIHAQQACVRYFISLLKVGAAIRVLTSAGHAVSMDEKVTPARRGRLGEIQGKGRTNKSSPASPHESGDAAPHDLT